MDVPGAPQPHRSSPPPQPPVPTPASTRSAPPAANWPKRPEPLPARPTGPTLEEVLSPRNLAIAGAIAVVAGLVFLVSYGISNGWISESLRVIGATVFSFVLAGVGVVLQERFRPGSPARALTVTGAAGLFLSLAAATRLYGLLDPAVALVLAATIGTLGAIAGLRWRTEPVAAAILGTALLSPLLIGTAYDTGLLVFLIPVFAITAATAILRPWPSTFTLGAALFLISMLACVIEADGAGTWPAFALAAGTLLLCAAGATGHSILRNRATEQVSSVIYGIFAAVAATFGMFLIVGSEPTDPDAWNAAWFGFAALLSTGIWAASLRSDCRTLATTAFALGSASLAFALGFLFESGPLLTLAWSLQSACLLAFGRDRWQRWVGFAAFTLAASASLVEAPPSLLFSGSHELLRDVGATAPLLVPLTLAAMKLDGTMRDLARSLVALVAAYLGMLTVGAVFDPKSVANLLPLLVAAAVPMLVSHAPWARFTLLFLTSVAIVFALLTSVPPDALIDGVPVAREAAAAMVAFGALAAVVWRRGPEQWRQPALWTGLAVCLYIVSALIIDGFQGQAGSEGGLPGRAQGQVIVSSLWAICGLALIVAGLVRQRLNWRKAGLILLILALLKITIYDLASLSTAGRTISFILVGLTLLAAAFAYQWMNRNVTT